MLINLSDIFKSDSLKELDNLKIKIISIKNNSTIILVKGHKIEIPYLLDINKNYILSFNKLNKNFEIIQKNNNQIQKENLTKEENIIRSIFEKIFDFSEIGNLKKEDFFNYFLNNQQEKENVKEKGYKNRNFIFKNDKKEFFFVFNILFLNYPCSLFLKISNNKSVSLIFYLKGKIDNKEEIIEDIKKELLDIIFEKIIIIENNKDFYLKEIEDLLQGKRIDLII